MRRYDPHNPPLPGDWPEPTRFRPLHPSGLFGIKEHHAYLAGLHWDIRLQIGPIFKSWVVREAPSRDPSIQLEAIQVADHSLEGLTAEGRFRRRYGAGWVYRWDYGEFVCNSADPLWAWHEGLLQFTLYGKRLRGAWQLSLKHPGSSSRREWVLEKLLDDWAQPGDVPVVLGAQWPARDISRSVQAVTLPLPLWGFGRFTD